MASQSYPKVSVIVPAYNETKYLDSCLCSLMNQIYPDYEVILVDDGSTDETPVIAQSYDLILLRQAHRGTGIARNLGAQHAQGDILVFADADLTYDPRFIERLTVAIRQGLALGTFTKEEYVANPQNIWSRCWSINSGLPANRRIPADHPNASIIFKAVDRQAFLAVGGYDEVGYGEDETLHRKLGVYAVEAPGAVCYHFNPASLGEVFSAARWVGRGETIRRKPLYAFRYTLPNSLRNAVVRAWQTRTPHFFVFKLVHDLGILLGILSRYFTGQRFK